MLPADGQCIILGNRDATYWQKRLLNRLKTPLSEKNLMGACQQLTKFCVKTYLTLSHPSGMLL